MTGRAIKATFADWRTVKGRKQLQLIFEVPLEQQQSVLTMLGAPNPSDPSWCGIALLDLKPEVEVVPDTSERSSQHNSADTTKAGDRKGWSDLPPAQQAGIRCNEKAFWKFLAEYEEGGPPIESTEDAANYVRLICGVKSRAQLTTESRARILWNDLDRKYTAWLLVPA